MKRSALVLGPSGRFGRHAARAFEDAGWQVRRFDRSKDDLSDAARGVEVIVNGWNPAYPDWAAELPDLTARVIGVAEANGALLIQPGSVYPFGKGAPERLTSATPHAARNPLGRLRAEMEAALRASSARVAILRGGDFLEAEPSVNWFDRVIVAGLARGRVTYPGPFDRPHAWAWLPDMARAAVALAERADPGERFLDVGFPGFTLTGAELHAALERVTGRPLRLRRMSWLPFRLAAPVWPMGRGLVEMSYLWRMPHRIDGAGFDALFPDFRPTVLDQALASAIHDQIDPDKAVVRGDLDRLVRLAS
ncbi:epimerase [Tropicimonas sp. IMCC34043]|uniref:epimerase n=1 Tax=Tropicimonas sp. IMCC34043 TaxID=2248760 RepID=UPI000E258DD3|nr:epimerase [Tropicimonas sp. IMCC34043]